MFIFYLAFENNKISLQISNAVCAVLCRTGFFVRGGAAVLENQEAVREKIQQNWPLEIIQVGPGGIGLLSKPFQKSE